MVGGEDVPVVGQAGEQGVEVPPAARHAVEEQERRAISWAGGAVEKSRIQPEGMFLDLLHGRFELVRELVRLAGLEPARVAPLPPQSSVSANSTISAPGLNEAVRRRIFKAILSWRGIVGFFPA